MSPRELSEAKTEHFEAETQTRLLMSIAEWMIESTTLESGEPVILGINLSDMGEGQETADVTYEELP